MNLNNLIINIQNNTTNSNEALSLLILEFKPIINNLCKKLDYPEAESDLLIFLIQLSKNINIKKYYDSNVIRWLLIKALKNKQIDLFRKNVIRAPNFCELNTDIMSDSLSEFESNIIIKEFISILPTKEKKIINDKFFLSKSDIEIADELCITRQSVNKSKNKALKTLRNALETY